jgi:hypothetical protein
MLSEVGRICASVHEIWLNPRSPAVAATDGVFKSEINEKCFIIDRR